jgi:D-glycero-D-manno-heptose 1,7-bisphosphate phosphatase
MSHVTDHIGLGPAPSERAVPLLVLDLDGTVRHGKDELGRFVNTAADVIVFPEAVAQMKAWKSKGGRIIAVSNQGGIALGHMSFADCLAAMVRTHELTGRLFDKIAFCRHHPNAIDPEYARCWCRKPSPGLLIETALDMAREHNEMYPPYMGLFVGDRPEDEECARLAGFAFQWAKDWRAAVVSPLLGS